MKIAINKVNSPAELESCLSIRHEVFIIGQKVPRDEEIDGRDGESKHYLLTVDGQAAGTARVRIIEHDAKIERVAILNAYQNKGLGKQLMRAILDDLKQQQALNKACLGSQTHAIPFYERLGFSVCSEEYMDAGIPHKDMHCPLRQSA